MTYESLGDIVCDVSSIFEPPERLTVSQAAEKYRFLNNPGSYVGPWKNTQAPYLCDPLDVLTSREFNAAVFVGPAQSGKTELILNWLGYSAKCDPADFIIYQTAMNTARDFSKRRIDRLHRHSPDIGNTLIGGQEDNIFDKIYRSGMMLTLSWPSINELSGRPVPRVALTDYDRMPMNVDGEGSPFDLARTRTTTFRSFAMTLCESSPGKDVTDPKWVRQAAHEAPPSEGILALYNRGDRRRWYWPCPNCGEFFEPEFALIDYVDSADIHEAGDSARMKCPHCTVKTGALIEPKDRYEMNQRGLWLIEGQRIDREGRVTGTPRRSDIASFWLKGPAAAFVTWRTLVVEYLKAREEFERTGSQEALKSVVNTKHGEPYFPIGTETARLPEELKSRAEAIPEKKVPSDVRFLTANVDVQKSSFVCQVHGVRPGGDIVIIDRFDIRKSERLDGDGERYLVAPGTYKEDWEMLIPAVIEKEYELEDGSGFMAIKLATCDSGGRKGVTSNAYEFVRKLKALGKSERFLLNKGADNKSAPRAHVSYPDSGRKDRTAGARGEIPVLMLNVDVLKDKLNGMLDRTDPGGGMIVLPDWLPDEVFAELTVEKRDPRKGWVNEHKKRNEAWDLLTYCIGCCVHLGVERFDWDAPPAWAAPWPENALVRKPDQEPRFTAKPKGTYGIKELASLLG